MVSNFLFVKHPVTNPNKENTTQKEKLEQRFHLSNMGEVNITKHTHFLKAFCKTNQDIFSSQSVKYPLSYNLVKIHLPTKRQNILFQRVKNPYLHTESNTCFTKVLPTKNHGKDHIHMMQNMRENSLEREGEQIL